MELQEAVEACEKLLGKRVTRGEHPGGRRRKSVRMVFDDTSVIVTRRSSSERAAHEVKVLKALAEQGATVPKVLAFDGAWLIQEDLGRRRLSQALADSNNAEVERYLDAAIEGLKQIHVAGKKAKLEQSVYTIGQKPGWLVKLIETPKRLSEYLDLPPPKLSQKNLQSLLRVTSPTLIKWDARPGNAICKDDGQVVWFDWEHSGCRNPLDDLVWLLADEYMPNSPKIEAYLFEKHLPSFQDDGYLDGPKNYLTTFGCLHMCVRLSLILHYQKKAGWRDWDYVLAMDKVGITQAAAQTLCRRAMRWAAQAPEIEKLVPWFEAVIKKLP